MKSKNHKLTQSPATNYKQLCVLTQDRYLAIHGGKANLNLPTGVVWCRARAGVAPVFLRLRGSVLRICVAGAALGHWHPKVGAVWGPY